MQSLTEDEAVAAYHTRPDLDSAQPPTNVNRSRSLPRHYCKSGDPGSASDAYCLSRHLQGQRPGILFVSFVVFVAPMKRVEAEREVRWDSIDDYRLKITDCKVKPFNL